MSKELRDSVDSTCARFGAPADEDEEMPDPELESPRNTTLYDAATKQEIEFAPGTAQFCEVGDRIYAVAVETLPQESQSLAGKLTGMVIDGFLRQGSANELRQLSRDKERTGEEIRRCLKVLAEDTAAWHTLLWGKVRSAVRARHPGKSADRIAAALVTSYLCLGEAGEQSLQALINRGNDALLDAAISRLLASSPHSFANNSPPTAPAAHP